MVPILFRRQRSKYRFLKKVFLKQIFEKKTKRWFFFGNDQSNSFSWAIFPLPEQTDFYFCFNVSSKFRESPFLKFAVNFLYKKLDPQVNRTVFFPVWFVTRKWNFNWRKKPASHIYPPVFGKIVGTIIHAERTSHLNLFAVDRRYILGQTFGKYPQNDLIFHTILQHLFVKFAVLFCKH